MKLWLLRPSEEIWDDDDNKNPWTPWHDKCFGFVIRAETEAEARRLADMNAGEENELHGETHSTWLDSVYSTCTELTSDGEPGIILQDFSAE